MSKLELLKPIHPGDILKTEFLVANNLSVEQLAQGAKLNKNTCQKLLCEEAPITYKLASHLSSYFDTSIDFWMNLQRIYEERTNDFIKQSLNQILTKKSKKMELEKEVQDSLTRNAEIKGKFQEKLIWINK